MQPISLPDAPATFRAGQHLAKKITAGTVIALIGELGSGKTTFVQGLAKGLGSKAMIQSPTYVLMTLYPLPRGSARRRSTVRQLVHADLYRLTQVTDIPGELLEYMADPTTVVAVEWPELITEYLPLQTLIIRLRHLSAGRALTMEGG